MSGGTGRRRTPGKSDRPASRARDGAVGVTAVPNRALLPAEDYCLAPAQVPELPDPVSNVPLALPVVEL
jgi:hypothetical protein